MAAYRAMCDEAKKDHKAFWGRLARQNLRWETPFSTTLDSSEASHYKWLPDGRLNVSFNCLDAQIDAGKGDKTVQTGCTLWKMPVQTAPVF